MLEFIDSVAKQAGTALRQRFRQKLKMSLKQDQSLVTEADLASDEVIRSAISERFPNDHIYSEETAKVALKGFAPAGANVWIVDPLDGTSNFAVGFHYFCVSIGLGRVQANGMIELSHGAVYAPYYDELYLVERGKGVLKNGTKLPQLTKLPADQSFERSFLVTGFYYDKGEALKEDVERFGAVAQKCQTIRRTGAAALDLAMVADGVFDAFWERRLKPWDVAAGVLMVREAGGIVSNYENQNYQMEDEGLIAGRPGTVDSIQKLL